MSDANNTSVNELLEDETDEQNNYLQTVEQASSLNPGLVHSATTDTLDSVYLDPPMGDQDPESAPGSDDKNAPQTSPPSLSKYFGSNENTSDPFAGDFFDNIPGIGENIENEVKDTADEVETAEVKTAEIPPDTNEVPVEVEEIAIGLDIQTQPDNDNSNNNHRSLEISNIESVGFDLEMDKNDQIETPVDIEGKDQFESFTADLADIEAMDALGMSPATTSYMTDRNFPDYFRQTSQAESFTRQISQTSAKSSSSQDQSSLQPDMSAEIEEQLQDLTLDNIKDEEGQENNGEAINEVIEAKLDNVLEVQAEHQPLFPPSTTLSPVDSPVHQPAFKQSMSAEDNGSTSVVPASPDHLVTTFQSMSDSGVGDDPFAVALQMSDSDREHDAWIPSEATKTILISMTTQARGSISLDKDMFCRPSLVITDPQGDPVRDLVYRYMGEQEALKRQVMNAESVSKDFDGIKKLMEAGCHRSAINLTGQLITVVGQAVQSESPVVHTPDTLQLWYCRFSLMMKLRMYNVAESEIVAFRNLDTPDIYYEFYPHLHSGKRGSMLPFGMRLVHAELPHHLGRSQETLDRLYYMLAIVQKILKNLDDSLSEDGSAVTITAESRKASTQLWQEREKQVYYIIGNTLVALKDYDAALSIYEILMEKDSEHKTALLSGMGRLHLQIGNLSKAVEYFQMVKSFTNEDNSAQVLMNRGFEGMCQNNFSEAYQHFKQAVQADPANTSAVNNMAVCCLYLGKLKEALKTLEALVHKSPDKNLHEGIMFNLCTLYELESSRALHKKQALLDLVSKHKGDGFPVVCLKMA